MKSLLLILAVVAGPVWAQDYLEELTEAPVESEMDAGRDPSALPPLNTKRSYPGGADEEDLRVQTSLPEAGLKTDARSVQREVFKSLYNQELKDDRHDPVEE